MQGVIQFIGLAHSGWSDRVHHFGNCVWIHSTVWIVTRSSAHAELERLGCWGEAACLVWTKAILAGQRDRKAPTRSWLSTKAGDWHTEGDEARDGIGADSN